MNLPDDGIKLKADIQCTSCREVFTLDFDDRDVSMGRRHLVDLTALRDKIAEGFGCCVHCGAKHYTPELYDGIDIALEELR